jgi:hypothetical protein
MSSFSSIIRIRDRYRCRRRRSTRSVSYSATWAERAGPPSLIYTMPRLDTGTVPGFNHSLREQGRTWNNYTKKKKSSRYRYWTASCTQNVVCKLCDGRPKCTSIGFRFSFYLKWAKLKGKEVRKKLRAGILKKSCRPHSLTIGQLVKSIGSGSSSGVFSTNSGIYFTTKNLDFYQICIYL